MSEHQSMDRVGSLVFMISSASPKKNNHVKRILLVENFQVFRDGFYSIIQSIDDMEISGEVKTAAELSQIPNIDQSDIVIVDLDLPDKNGFEVCLDLANKHPSLTTLLLCDHNWDIYLALAYKVHSAGVLERRSPTKELIDMIRQAPAKSLYTSNQLLRIEEWQRTVGTELTALKPREWKVLSQLSNGLKNSEIADLLVISKGSVEKYIGNLLTKFNLNSRSSLIAYIHNQHLDVLCRLSEDTRVKLIF
jgi:DNA-binding NarL/FixJ family response regulator